MPINHLRRQLSNSGVLGASFSAFYRPPGTDRTVPLNEFAVRARRFRVCPSCAAENFHLTLHQLLDCVRCPLHDEPLVECCPGCGDALRCHRFPPPECGSSLRCTRCGWNAGSTSRDRSDAIEAGKRELVAGYVRWMDRIGQAVDGRHGRIRLLDRLRRLGALANVHALIRGPDWVGTCLVDGSRTRVHRIGLPEAVYRAPPTDGPYTRFGGDVHDKSLRTRLLWARQQVRTVRQARAMNAALSAAYNPDDRCAGVYEHNHMEWPDSVSACNVVPLGLYWWRCCLWPLTTDLSSHDERFFRDYDVQKSFLWPAWEAGPAALLWRRDRSAARWENEVLVEQVSRIWTEHVLRRLLFSLIVRASITPSDAVWVCRRREEADRLGGMPLIALRRWRGQLSLAIVMTMASEHHFDRLLRRGLDERRGGWRRHPIERLHDLAGLPVAIRERTAEQLRRRQIPGWRRAVADDPLTAASTSARRASFSASGS